LKGSGIGHALLNLVPSRALRGRHSWAGGDAPRIAQLKFQIASSGFGAFAAAVVAITAVQRGWRDIRMAQ
jgi:hypothetical protein